MPESKRTDDSEVKSSEGSDPWTAKTYHCDLQRFDSLKTELRRLLNMLLEKPQRFLIISIGEGARYVQFEADKYGGVFAESVSNRFLTGSERLNKSACSKLIELSWNKPGKKSPNFWKQFLQPEVDELVSLTVRTLFEVFEVVSPSQLSFRRGEFTRESAVERARQRPWTTLWDRTNRRMLLLAGAENIDRKYFGCVKHDDSFSVHGIYDIWRDESGEVVFAEIHLNEKGQPLGFPHDLLGQDLLESETLYPICEAYIWWHRPQVIPHPPRKRPGTFGLPTRED